MIFLSAADDRFARLTSKSRQRDDAIVRLEHQTDWSLEVVNSASTSIVWDDLFASDDEAFAEFERTVAEEGMRTFLDKGNVIPLRR